MENAELWACLVSGREGNLPRQGDGQVDLRGLHAPTPVVTKHRVAGLERMDNLLTIRDGNWNALDMSRARLDSLRFFETTIADCSFDHAKCHDWRLWGSTVQRTSFRHANLRRSVLGGVDTRYRTNSFVDVDFSKADFRQTVHRSATYTRCKFTETNLTKVDFDGSVFVDCVFAGG